MLHKAINRSGIGDLFFYRERLFILYIYTLMIALCMDCTRKYTLMIALRMDTLMIALYIDCTQEIYAHDCTVQEMHSGDTRS